MGSSPTEHKQELIWDRKAQEDGSCHWVNSYCQDPAASLNGEVKPSFTPKEIRL